VGDYSQPGAKGMATQPASQQARKQASKQVTDNYGSGVQLIGVDKPGPH